MVSLAITHFMMGMEFLNLYNLTLNIPTGCQDLNKQEMWSKKLSEFHRNIKSNIVDTKESFYLLQRFALSHLMYFSQHVLTSRVEISERKR